MPLEPELIADWHRLHQAKNPMSPKDPDDVALGWVYSICSHWKQSKSMLTEWELLQGKTPKEEITSLGYENTLNDARLTMEICAAEAEIRLGLYYRRMGVNRFYASDGEQMHTICIIAVEDDNPENI